jgi:hypothetical protein
MSLMLDLFPNDVRNLIYEMNPEHRELFNSFKSELELKGVNSRLETLYNHYYTEDDDSLAIVFRRLLDDPNYVIQKLRTCECCSRHENKKPISLSDRGNYDSNASPYTVIETPGGFVHMIKKTCECSCRQYSRLIFDAFDDNSRYFTNHLEDDEYFVEEDDYFEYYVENLQEDYEIDHWEDEYPTMELLM